MVMVAIVIVIWYEIVMAAIVILIWYEMVKAAMVMVWYGYGSYSCLNS
jgi:hypothetical protein